MNEMRTKYGDIPDVAVEGYCDKLLVGKIFKLLPIWEDENPTFAVHHARFMDELVNGKELSPAFRENPYYVSLIFSLEGLLNAEDHQTVKGIVLGCIDIAKKINSSL